MSETQRNIAFAIPDEIQSLQHIEVCILTLKVFCASVGIYHYPKKKCSAYSPSQVQRPYSKSSQYLKADISSLRTSLFSKIIIAFLKYLFPHTETCSSAIKIFTIDRVHQDFLSALKLFINS